jgi:hypothetical protein
MIWASVIEFDKIPVSGADLRRCELLLLHDAKIRWR